MSVIKITKDNYNEVINTNKPVLLDFYADWCGPCRMLSPVIEEISDEHPEIVVGKVNVDAEGELAAMFGVMSIPMVAVIKDGELCNKSVGAKPKGALLRMLEG